MLINSDIHVLAKTIQRNLKAQINADLAAGEEVTEERYEETNYRTCLVVALDAVRKFNEETNSTKTVIRVNKTTTSNPKLVHDELYVPVPNEVALTQCYISKKWKEPTTKHINKYIAKHFTFCPKTSEIGTGLMGLELRAAKKKAKKTNKSEWAWFVEATVVAKQVDKHIMQLDSYCKLWYYGYAGHYCPYSGGFSEVLKPLAKNYKHLGDNPERKKLPAKTVIEFCGDCTSIKQIAYNNYRYDRGRALARTEASNENFILSAGLADLATDVTVIPNMKPLKAEPTVGLSLSAQLSNFVNQE